MSVENIITVLGLVLGAIGGAGFWSWLTSRREAPIKKKDADLAVAHTSQQMALGLAEALQEQLTNVKAEQATMKTDIKALQETVAQQAGTITFLRGVVQAFQDGWDELTANWHTLRQREHPPKNPRKRLQEQEAGH